MAFRRVETSGKIVMGTKPALLGRNVRQLSFGRMLIVSAAGLVLLVVALPLPIAAYIWSARARGRRRG